MHAEVAADHAAAIPRPDRASARGVVAPGPGADEIPKFIVALKRVAGLLLGRDQATVFDFFCQFADKADASHNRIQILPGGVAALLEIVEVDQRRVARICRAQTNLARAVLCVRLGKR